MEYPPNDPIERELRHAALRKDTTVSEETKQKRTALAIFSRLISSHDVIIDEVVNLSKSVFSAEGHHLTSSEINHLKELFETILAGHQRHAAIIWDILPDLCGRDIPQDVVDRLHKNKSSA